MKNNNVISRPSHSIFDAFFQPFIMEDEKIKKSVRSLQLRYNILESDEGFIIELAVPGLNKKDIKMDIVSDTLTVSHEIKSEEEKEISSAPEKSNYLKHTFDYAGFEKSFKLPKNIDNDSISAAYTNGVLSINLPKKEHVKKEIRIS